MTTMKQRLHEAVEGEKRYNLRRRPADKTQGDETGQGGGDSEQGPRSKDLNTALLSVARKGTCEAGRTLVSNGADVDFKDRGGNTALLLAAKGGHRKMVDMLLKWGSNPNAATRNKKYTALHLAAEGGDMTMAEALLADPQTDVNLQTSEGHCALGLALKEEHDKLAKLVLNHDKCDINSCGVKGKPPLYWAVERGDSHWVQLLLGSGADPNLPSGQGADLSHRPLLRAAQGGHRSIVRLLLSVGAEPAVHEKILLTALEDHNMEDLCNELKQKLKT